VTHTAPSRLRTAVVNGSRFMPVPPQETAREYRRIRSTRGEPRTGPWRRANGDFFDVVRANGPFVQLGPRFCRCLPIVWNQGSPLRTWETCVLRFVSM